MSKHHDHVGATEKPGPVFYKPTKVKRSVWTCGMSPVHQHATRSEAEECIVRTCPVGEGRPVSWLREVEIFE